MSFSWTFRYKSRQYCVGLSARGRNAISKVEGLWEAVEQAGVPTSQFVVHTGSKSIPLKRNPDKPSLLINQRTLAAILVSELRNRYSKDEVEVCLFLSLDYLTLHNKHLRKFLYRYTFKSDVCQPTSTTIQLHLTARSKETLFLITY